MKESGKRCGVRKSGPGLPFSGFRPATKWVYPPWKPAGSKRTYQFLSPFRPTLSSSLP
jgi:hypothetical protein